MVQSLTLVRGVPRCCVLCGRSGRGEYRRSATDDLYCAEHPWCRECRVAHRTSVCPELDGAVTAEPDALQKAASVLSDLRELGISLPTVPLTLVNALPGPEQGRCLKLTALGKRVGRSARIDIRAGLGPTRFGHVVAHEHTHALVHLNGGPAVEPVIEEGVCELVAVVWLTSKPTSDEVLRGVWDNPDPVYGEQMRRVVTLARRDGVATVLDRVLRTGRPE